MRKSLMKPIVFCLAFAALAALAQPALAGLLLNYQFESVSADPPGSQTTPDSSPNGLTGTFKGSTTYGYPTIVSSPTPLHPGDNPNSVMSCPGGGGANNTTTYPRLEVADAASGPLDAAFTSFTFTAWVNPNATTATGLIAGKMGKASGDRGWQVVRSPAGYVNGLGIDFNQTTLDTDPALSVTAVNFFTDSTWTHVAVTFSASPDGVIPGTVDIYKDGVLFNSNSTLMTALNGLNTAPFQVGNRGVVRGTPSFSGYIDDVRIYNETLSAAQVAAVAGVPEPGTLILLLISSIGLVAAYRRR
jgi:hypothetical protein